MAKILIADDSDIGRASIRTILSKQIGWTICGEAVNGRNAVLMAHDLKPDLIIMDFSMPMLDGLQASKEILRATPEVPIIVFTFHMTPQLNREASRVGIRKVVSKSDGANALRSAVEALLDDRNAPVGTREVAPDPLDDSHARAVEQPVGPLGVAPDQPLHPAVISTETPAVPPIATAADSTVVDASAGISGQSPKEPPS
jgi:DNA-binding NarL/FixJ family response regulator